MNFTTMMSLCHDLQMLNLEMMSLKVSSNKQRAANCYTVSIPYKYSMLQIFLESAIQNGIISKLMAEKVLLIN